MNAYDNGSNTLWDNGAIGNYWHDYNGKDINDNGIGDIPYYIDGNGKGIDRFPIWDDGPEPGNGDDDDDDNGGPEISFGFTWILLGAISLFIILFSTVHRIRKT